MKVKKKKNTLNGLSGPREIFSLYKMDKSFFLILEETKINFKDEYVLYKNIWRYSNL